MRKLLITLVVLAIVLIGADFALRFIATDQIGKVVQSELGLDTAPNVSISGFPFVLQAINGEYEAINATLPATTLGPVADVAVNLDLLGVRIPLSDALAGNANALTAASSRVRVVMPVASIAAAVGLPDLAISQQGSGLLASATLTVLGQRFPVSATLDATVVDSRLELRTGEITGAGVTVPAEVLQTVSALVNLSIPFTDLPFTITSGTVSVVSSGLVLDAATSALGFAR